MRTMPDLLLVLIVVLIVAVIWRGPKNLPQIGEMLGRGVKEARKEASDIRSDMQGRTDGDGPAGSAGTGDAPGTGGSAPGAGGSAPPAG